MKSSDAELMRDVRGQVGISKDGDLPEQVLQKELERGKEEINRELRERLNNGDGIDYFKSDEQLKALENFVKLRAKAFVKGNQNSRGKGSRGPPDHANAPASVSSMRRHDFGDETMNHWRDRMITHLNRITE